MNVNPFASVTVAPPCNACRVRDSSADIIVNDIAIDLCYDCWDHLRTCPGIEKHTFPGLHCPARDEGDR